MKKPINTAVDWQEPDAEEIAGEQITKRGQHHMAAYLENKKAENAERRERHLRNFGGRERDPNRVPPPEAADSGRTWKSSSKVRFPSRAFLRNFEFIDWSR